MSSSTLSEVYGDYPLKLHHIKPLDFASLQAVPDSHVWPQSDDVSFGVSSADEQYSSVPIIDLTDSNATELIRQACETWGVFQLKNHGIDLSLLNEVEYEAAKLFALSARQKLKALRSPGGATGYGIARITPFFSKYMWHEGFTIMGSPIDHAKDLWPHHHERFCDVMENYQKNMKGLAERLVRLIFKSLNISDEESWLGSISESGSACTALQLNSYPSCPDPNQAMGLAPHTDTSILTILHQTQTSGLQIFKDGVGWLPVPPVDGALVVNMGDLFHILSNARFPNVLHRVVVNGTQQRLSVAYFYGPPTDFIVSPFSKVLNSGQVPHYRSVTVKDYVTMKAKNLEKALSLIRT
jgi:gibberellin 3-beta-dioxygenase|uniref:gibberellin 3beta-dioxygenase n=1 Tax=Fagus sylvatica TaxID=28930 RepID=A0A2N9IUG0_FAGSY